MPEPMERLSVSATGHAISSEIHSPLLWARMEVTTIWFIVGKGDVASVTDVVYELRGTPTGSFAGFVFDAQTGAPVERASILVRDDTGWVTQADSDAGGAFKMNLPDGAYEYTVVTGPRRPTAMQSLVVTEGVTTSRRIPLSPPGRIAVFVRDEVGRAVPAKVQLVGRFDAAHLGEDPRDFLYDLSKGERSRTTTLDPTRTEFIENSWYVAGGVLVAEVVPGAYDLVVSRGVEYDLLSVPVVVSEGAFVTSSVQLRRAFSTDGYVATGAGSTFVLDLQMRIGSIRVDADGADRP